LARLIKPIIGMSVVFIDTLCSLPVSITVHVVIISKLCGTVAAPILNDEFGTAALRA
jgi:hypothetical protein